ncbi:hypothetical protein BpHYR1_014326 [Brachionus plicatilis]|uniref:Uncharacterized protein n=1 Tax=Brachionus plicatilis TaxID=10195 RepID=A0A3M7Q6V9_BRAPC|nr:hypothetical protein BpHYR1_014326 [Brachionus plicatilis]
MEEYLTPNQPAKRMPIIKFYNSTFGNGSSMNLLWIFHDPSINPRIKGSRLKSFDQDITILEDFFKSNIVNINGLKDSINICLSNIVKHIFIHVASPSKFVGMIIHNTLKVQNKYKLANTSRLSSNSHPIVRERVLKLSDMKQKKFKQKIYY